MSVVDLLPLALLGGVCGLDMVSFPQAMISRPIVAATLAGAFAGSPEAGLTAGAVLELIALETLPFGASRYPEWGTAGVVGGALMASALPAEGGGERVGALAAASFGALVTAMVSGSSMVALRRLIGRRSAALRGAIENGSRDAVMRLQLFGLTADLVRAVGVTLVMLLVLGPISDAVSHLWTLSRAATAAALLAIGGAVASGIVWNTLPTGGRIARVSLGAGGAAVAALWWISR